MATYIVTNTVDGAPGSLREAIFLSNASAGADTIEFDSLLNGQTLDVSEFGELIVTDDLTIDGDLDDDGNPDITVDANEMSRVFNLDDGNSTADKSITLEGLIVTGGNVSGSFLDLKSGSGAGIFNSEIIDINNSIIEYNDANYFGGGLYNEGIATITNTSIENNGSGFDGSAGGIDNVGEISIVNSSIIDNRGRSTGGFSNSGIANLTSSIVSGNSSGLSSGGITNYSDGQLTISDSTIDKNSSQSGGGITNFGTTTINNSTISNNSALYYSFTGVGGRGGGIENNGGTLTINGSTVSGNTAGFGGGIANLSTSEEISLLTVTNSTISNNLVSSFEDVYGYGTPQEALGGGIYNEGIATFNNSTISGNAASGDGNVNGGGIANYNDGTTNLNSTILAGNSAPIQQDLLRELGIINATFSLIQKNNGQLNGIKSNLVQSQDPQLDPAGLQDNGGPTETIALQPGSPAIDAGSNALDLETDQRGFVTREVNGQADIGAFEVGAKPNNLVVNTLIDEFDGNINDGDVSLRDAIAAIADGGTITFDPELDGGTIELALGELLIEKSLTVDGDRDNDGNPDITVDANGMSRVLKVDDGNGIADKNVALEGLIITGGDSDFEVGGGAGIFNNEILNVTNSSIENNYGYYSGGIYNADIANLTLSSSNVSNNNAYQGAGGINNAGKVTITDSTIEGNGTANDAGGITNEGELILSNSKIENNSVGFFGAAGLRNSGNASIISSIISGNNGESGGGIFNSGELEISYSSITNNSAFAEGFLSGKPEPAYGGGIDNSGTATIKNSTISGNSSNGIGGGIFNSTKYYGLGDLTIINSTIANNLATADTDDRGNSFGGGIGGGLYNEGGTVTLNNSTVTGNEAEVDGGGIANYDGGTTNLNSTILAGNSAPIKQDLLRESGTINATFSLIQKNNGQLNGIKSNLVQSQDPQLDPTGLQDKGGPTATIALLASSPAIDAGNNPLGLETDQRGVDREVNGQADIGAFEFLPDLFSFELYDAITDSLIGELVPGENIVGADVDTTQLTIVGVSSDPTTESVEFNYNDGEIHRIENFVPYSLFGDRAGDFNGGTIPLGVSQTIQADAFSQNGGQGDLLGSSSLEFFLTQDVV